MFFLYFKTEMESRFHIQKLEFCLAEVSFWCKDERSLVGGCKCPVVLPQMQWFQRKLSLLALCRTSASGSPREKRGGKKLLRAYTKSGSLLTEVWSSDLQ